MRHVITIESILIVLLCGCAQTGGIQNPLPEITDLTGPTGVFNDEDYKISTTTVELKGWSDTAIRFRFARDIEDDLKTPNSTEIPPTCSDGQTRACSIIFPNAFTNQGTVFEVGTTVFYQWFIDYKLPDETEVATIESPVRSFEIEEAVVCVNAGQCSTDRVCAAATYFGDPADEQVLVQICIIPAPCPVGDNELTCSGHGQCEQTTGQCLCEPDYREADCGIVCQRCYGAAGNNCGAAEGGFGYCSFDNGYSLPQGMSMRQACESQEIDVPDVTCQISVGSWTHDECCVIEGESGSCSVGSIVDPNAVCQVEGNLAAGEFAQQNIPGTTTRVWTRSVDPCIEVCGVHGPSAERVRRADMCANFGDTLSCTSTDAAGAFCCNNSASATSIDGICRCD